MIKDKVAALGIKAIRAITGLQRQGYRDPGYRAGWLQGGLRLRGTRLYKMPKVPKKIAPKI